MIFRNALTPTCLILFIIVLCLTSCSQQYTTFSNYGFSFEYPGDYSIREFGIKEEDGKIVGSQLQVRPKEGYGGIQINWVNTRVDEYNMIYLKLEDSIEADFNLIEQSESIASIDRGEIVESEKDGNRMLYSYYTITPVEGGLARGIGAVFHYREAGRFISLFTTNDISCSDDEIMKKFEEFLDSFTFDSTS